MGRVAGVLVPRALVMDYGTFETAVLPELQKAAGGDASWAFNPGATDLPQASIEEHVTERALGLR